MRGCLLKPLNPILYTVIFDLDSTLTKKDTYIPFLVACLKEFGLRRISIILLPFYILLYVLGIITNSRLKEIFLEKFLSGITIDRLGPVAERFISSLLNSGLNKSIVKILNTHLNQKHKVILATASFDLYVLRLAERLGIKYTVCTISEVRDGIITGRILGNNCYGEEKVKRIENLLNPSDWSSTILYTDHHSDLPLLRKVKQGFLVNPGVKTRKLLKGYNFSTLLS